MKNTIKALLFFLVHISSYIFAAPTLSVEVGSCQVIDKQCFRNIQLLVKGGSGSYQKGFKIKNASIIQWFAWDDAGIVGGFLIPVGSYTFAIKDLKSNQIIEKSIDLTCDEVCMPTFQINTSQSVCKSINNMCFQSVTLSTKNGSGGYLKAVRVGNNYNLTGIIWSAWSTGGDGVLNLLSNATAYTIFVKDTIQNKIASQIIQINCPENCVDKLSLKFEKNACKNKEAKCYQDIILKVSGGTGNYEKGIRKGTSLDPSNGVISWSKWDDGSYSLLPGNYTFFVRDIDSEQIIADTSSAACPDRCLAPLSMLTDLQQCFKVQDTCRINVIIRASGATGQYQLAYKKGLNANSNNINWLSWNFFGENGLIDVPAGNYTFFVRDTVTQEVVSSSFSESCKVCNPKLELLLSNNGCESDGKNCSANITLTPNGGLGNYQLGILEGKDSLQAKVAWQIISKAITLNLLPKEYTFYLKDVQTGDQISKTAVLTCPQNCQVAINLVRSNNNYYTNFGQNEYEEIKLNISSGTPYKGNLGKYRYNIIERLMTQDEVKSYILNNRNSDIWKWWTAASYFKLQKQKNNSLTVIAIDSSQTGFTSDTLSYSKPINCDNIGTPTFFSGTSKKLANYEWANLNIKGCSCITELKAFDENTKLLSSLIINDNQVVTVPFFTSEMGGQIQNGGNYPSIKMQDSYIGKKITFEARCTNQAHSKFSDKLSYTIEGVTKLDDIGFSPCIENDDRINLHPEGSREEFEFYIGEKNNSGEKIWRYYGAEPYGSKSLAIKVGQQISYRTIDDNSEGETFVIPSSLPSCSASNQRVTAASVFDIGLKVFPNPVASTINISFSTEQDNSYYLYLVDEMGRIYHKSFFNNIANKKVEHAYNSDSLPSGSYKVIVIDAHQRKSFYSIHKE